MPLKYMKPIKAEYLSQTIKPGMGENQYGTPFTIDEAESVTSRNLSSRSFPAMQVRPGRAVAFSALTTPNGIGARNDSTSHVLDGTVWKAWNVNAWATIKNRLTSARANFIDFTTGTTKYTIMSNGTDRCAWEGTTAVVLTEAPLTRLLATHRFRLFALIGRELKFTAINLPNDWTTALQAGTITIANAKSDGTAIIEYANHLVLFTANSMHELHGTNYDNFQLVDISEDGCTAERTLIELNGVLYFLDESEFKAYAGSKPVVISQKVQNYLKAIPSAYKYKACCGKLGKYLYLSIPYGAVTENNLLLEYDTELKQWYPQTGSFVDFVAIGEKLYGVDDTGVIWDMDNGTTDAGTAISWYKESGAYMKQSARNKKFLQNVHVVFDQPSGSTLTLATSETVDSSDFVTRKTFTADSAEQNVNTVLDANILGYTDWYRLKLAGTGPATVHMIEQVYRLGR